MRLLIPLLGLTSLLSGGLLAQAPKNTGNVNVEFSVYLWPSAADLDGTPHPGNPPAEKVNEDGIVVTPTPEEAVPPTLKLDKKLTPEQEAKLVRYAGRDGKMVLPLLGGNTTPFLTYRGPANLELFREKKGADGSLQRTVVGSYEFPANSKKVALILRSTDMNETFQVDGFEINDEILPKGNILFFNSSAKPLEIEVPGGKTTVEAKHTSKCSLEAVKDYKLPCKLFVRNGEGPAATTKKALSTNLYFARQDLRLVYYVFEVSENSNRFDMMAIDPFQGSDK